MLKALVGSGLKQVPWRRIQLPASSSAAALQHLVLELQNGRNGASKWSPREGEAMPLEQQWIPRSYYSTGSKYNKKAGDGKGTPTVRQKRISTEVMEVISEALQQGPCYSPVLQRCGFQILKTGKLSLDKASKDFCRDFGWDTLTYSLVDGCIRVKMSSDLRTAHVLWTALPGMQMTAEKAAISKVLHLRSLVFRRMNLPFSPIIKFQEDKPSQETLALDKAFAKLKEEEGEGQDLKGEKGEDQNLKEEEVEGHNLKESGEGGAQNARGSNLEKENSSIVP